MVLMIRHLEYNKERAMRIFFCLFVCVRTKKLIVDVIRIQPGETLPEVLDTPATAPQVMFSSITFGCYTHFAQIPLLILPTHAQKYFVLGLIKTFAPLT